jgi:putative oxidoreductase
MRRFEPHAFALLRIITGLLFAMHGTQKLFSFPSSAGIPHPLPPMLLAASVIELVTGLMMALGVFASYAAFLAAGEMAVAYLMVHFQLGKASFWPIVNKGEPAVVYCFVFLYIFAHGAGIWAVTKK